MTKIKVGIIREEKIPHDKRVALTPGQCVDILKDYPNVSLVIQPSSWRAYKDEEYANAGIALQEDVSDCDILIGIKEVPKQKLLDGTRLILEQLYGAKK